MRFGLFSAFLATVISCNTEQLPYVTIETEKGNIIIELYPEAAPATVANFAKLIASGFYDGVVFHRFVPGFVIQGGDPDGTGTGGPGWTIPGEFQDPNLREKMPVHEKGVVAMARTQNPDSAGSQFYICISSDPSPYAHLNGSYTTFGKVIEGIDVVDALRERDVMNKVTIENYTEAP
jgi:cyclophilin family peptidyl-prolyl cis-trans isomerase